ncbi:MAG TPA: Dot/Icm secretion system protein IcmQ [Coxiellaceae bacterium]|nr:MAG: Dot/Icm secretion system protein IcmQ [Gammaproteobacteria bacterium RIFCSPHIGHO2_12_FULL_36_30]HLB56232.1 Dot/Icm secretion system protein IcmQ [Coxiellaceae bacterium]
MDKTSGLLSDFKGQELKKKLLECLDKEAHEFSEIARTYFDKEHLSKDDKAGLLNAVISTVNHVVSAGDWNSSLFLRNTIKPLLAIKEEAEAELDHLHVKVSEKSIKIRTASENEVEVYISLFQSDGYNINKWAMQLRSLDRYVVGRPVYQNEADIEKRIRLRNAAANEAYVAVIVKKMDVQFDPFAAPLKDQFDHSLLLLKETALKHGRIIAFVHQGIRYHFVDGQLVKA